MCLGWNATYAMSDSQLRFDQRSPRCRRPRWRDLCGLYWLESEQDSSSSDQRLFFFFCVEVKATIANISNTGCVLGMKTLACAVKDCLVVMNQNNVSWPTSHKSCDLVCLCVCVCIGVYV